MDKKDMVHIAIVSPDTPGEDLVKKVADIINKDLYGTRLLLAGNIPRIVAHYQDMPTAEPVARNLRALGLTAIVCRDSELRKPSRGFKAHTLTLGEEGVIFQDRDGETKRIETANAFMILKGARQSYTEKKTTSTRLKLNVPGTLLTGGIPVFRKVKENTRDISTETECFVRLYDRISAEPSAEIFQYDFDYSFLGAKLASSTFTNLNTTITELRDRFTQAVFDDSLTRPIRVDIPATTPEDDIEINCRLIFRYHQAVSNPGSSVQEYET